ncbi:5595_t:CDS:2 [Funneliformis geosporum]|uniref:5595_t:CDS:1 n=1 Tax=Funneliformis geosporum TaxID=1117311 RepID=A0A9W4WS08_9GLOM|nr:5595_t:CDS:2 [Funneliformis geosporum]
MDVIKRASEVYKANNEGNPPVIVYDNWRNVDLKTVANKDIPSKSSNKILMEAENELRTARLLETQNYHIVGKRDQSFVGCQ